MEQGDVYQDNFAALSKDWQLEVDRQNEELLAWIDEFLESDEYVEALQQKVQTLHAPKSYQDAQDVDGHRPPTADSRKHQMQLLEDKIQKSLVRLKIMNTVANQREGIEIIRQKIQEAKRRYDANRMQIAKQIEDNEMNALMMLREDYNLSVRPSDLTGKVVSKLMRQRDAATSRTTTGRKKKIQVVANILRDMKRDQLEKRSKHGKVSHPRGKKKSGIQISVETTSEQLTEQSLVADSAETPPKSLFEGVVDTIVDQEKEEKVSKVTVATTSKASKKPKEKASKKQEKPEQTGKPQLANEDSVVPSVIPNLNPRKIILPEYVLPKILEDITKLSNYLRDKERHEVEDALTQDIMLPFDDGFFSQPNKVIFKDYEPGKKYKKTITLVNGNPSAKKIRLERVIWNSDIEEELLLEMEPFGVHHVLPGMSIRMWLRFVPEMLNKTIDGKIVFVTQRARGECAHQFVVQVVCVPLCAAVLISPTVLSFEEMPIWRARTLMRQGRNYKTITVRNAGLKECKVVVTKIFNNQTIEQEWKKIISIIRIEDGERHELSSSNFEDPAGADPFPRNLVQQCVESVFNVFKFERNVFSVLPKSTVGIKCWLKELSEPGYQVESYNFSIYERFLDGQLYCIGTKDVIVNSETSSHFLVTSVDILDFEVCAYGSVYQLDFDLTNPCKLAHHVRICFPSRMRTYLQANPRVTSVLPNQTTKICIKFLPTSDIIADNKFYDTDVGLLDFPIFVTVLTKSFEDTPPMRIDVFAAVTEAQGVVLEPMQGEVPRYEAGEWCFHLGHCTTVETIYLDIWVKNISLVPQQFAFLNLPQFVIVMPNFGFGQLKPMQKVSVRVMISPTMKDLENLAGSLSFKLVVSTIKANGALKKRISDRNIMMRLKNMEELVSKSRGSDTCKLKEDMQSLVEAYKTRSLVPPAPSMRSTQSFERFVAATDDEELQDLVKQDMEEGKETPSSDLTLSSEQMKASLSSQGQPPAISNKLQLCVDVDNVIAKLSHNVLLFPPTPCGSCSMMNIQLTMRKLAKMATFTIAGDNVAFEVQPTIGKLEPGGKRRLYVLVRPDVPQNVVEERLKQQKEQERLEQQQQQQQEQQTTTATTGKAKTKQRPKKPPSVKALVINSDDYYQAEMNVWHTMEPHLIEGTFTVLLTHTPLQPPEELRFKVGCQVIAPNFIHDQKHQVVDFGLVLVGTSVVKTINFKNIQQKNIIIDVSLLNPCGSYSTMTIPGSSIPPEYIYSYTVRFTPTEERSEVEFLDAVSESTTYNFILRGVGKYPQLTFTPDFTVCRLSVSKSGFVDCIFDVRNQSEVDIQLRFEKVCELEGKISPMEGTKSPAPISPKSKNGKKKNADKRKKFSEELLDDEQYALSNTFAVRDAATSAVFHVVDNTDLGGVYNIGALAKCHIVIRCSSSSNTSSGINSYATKYNLFVGQYYIKDVIILSSIV